MGRKKNELTETELKKREKEYQHQYYLKKTKEKRAKKKAIENKDKAQLQAQLNNSFELSDTDLENGLKEGKIKACAICGVIFVPKNKRQKYCCENCKKEALKRQEKIRKQDPLYVEKMKAWRKEYYKSDKYKAVRDKYHKSEKFKAVLKKYKETEQGKAKNREISKRAYAKYYAKKRQLEAKTICPICKKEFVRDIEHRIYCCEECKKMAQKVKNQLNYFIKKKNS